MSARKKTKLLWFMIATFLFHLSASSAEMTTAPAHTLTYAALARQLGWVENPDYPCGGYYLDQPFVYPISVKKNNLVEITSTQGSVISTHATSILGKVIMTRSGQQITANKAYLYRDPETWKLLSAEMIGNVRLRERNTLIVAKRGRYYFETKSKSLFDILYRTTINNKPVNNRQIVEPKAAKAEAEKGTARVPNRVKSLSAWGKAYEFSQTEPNVYELSRASFSTCPPINPAWRVKASKIVLNKNIGRGYATNTRILVKGVPVFYMPYFNFSIDNRRKSGFLWPSAGGSNKWGPYILTPFYWNMAPNYDMTMTPGLLTKRGVQLSDNFRYLTGTSSGNINVSVLPEDKRFSQMQKAFKQKFANGANTSIKLASVTNAELNRLLRDANTRKGLSWRDESRFNDHWSSHINFNYAGDDYYYRDFGNLDEITQDQLAQEGDLYYKGKNWNFTTRIQTYQTLHPVDEPPVLNQYRRFPQLIFNGDYPNQAFGLEYFINSEITHFEMLKTPGTDMNLPIGNRLHLQPGVNLPLYWPSFYINPRAQIALTDYQIHKARDAGVPHKKQRSIPIVDVNSGLLFNRDIEIFNHGYQQTLEPQIYYTYVPYHNQSSIPIFDTAINTLTYDQIFNYNRFSGIDRIGDANQIGVGVTTRFINQRLGLEKVRLGIGEIIYFAARRVTFCNNPSSNTSPTCTDYPNNPDNHRRLSPVSGLFNYNINPMWSFGADMIWNPVSKQLDNSTLGFHYKPDNRHIVNLGYGYVHNGDILSGSNINGPINNLKLTDVSFAWPITHDVSAVLRWSQDWNANRLQNLLYGLQYDSCCWAVRLVGGREFTNLQTTNNKPEYINEFYVQFALKGLGDVGSGNSGLLNSITNYNAQLG